MSCERAVAETLTGTHAHDGDGERLPQDRLEAAILSQLAELYRDGRLIEPAVAYAATHTARERPRIEEQLGSARAEIGPEQAKELLRLLIKEIRVHNRRRIVSTYRVPAAVRAMPRKVGGTLHCANQPLLAAGPFAVA